MLFDLSVLYFFLPGKRDIFYLLFSWAFTFHLNKRELCWCALLHKYQDSVIVVFGRDDCLLSLSLVFEQWRLRVLSEFFLFGWWEGGHTHPQEILIGLSRVRTVFIFERQQSEWQAQARCVRICSWCSIPRNFFHALILGALKIEAKMARLWRDFVKLDFNCVVLSLQIYLDNFTATHRNSIKQRIPDIFHHSNIVPCFRIEIKQSGRTI